MKKQTDHSKHVFHFNGEKDLPIMVKDLPRINGKKYEGQTPSISLDPDVIASFDDGIAEGWQRAKESSGSVEVLMNNLPVWYGKFTEHVRQHSHRKALLALSRNKTNQCLQKESEELRAINNRKRSERIPGIEMQISNLKNEMEEKKNNPQEYAGKTEKTILILGTIILSLLTCYLIIFYSSASYSSFFRVFEPGVNLKEAMLDPNTFLKAYRDGIGELLFICLMPFIFISLGFLVHRFTEKQSILSYMQVFLLLVVAFVFDGFLAFKIAEGIESVNQTLTSEEFTLSRALKEIDFWVVIFAGFVTYIVWGLLFEFVKETRQNLDKTGKALKILENRIIELQIQIQKDQRAIELNEEKINKLNLQIARNYDEVIYPSVTTCELERIHNEFLTGYKNYMVQAGLSSEIIKAQRIANNCLENYIYNHTKNQ